MPEATPEVVPVQVRGQVCAHVCTTCRVPEAGAEPAATPRAGAVLAEALAALAGPALAVEPVACLGNCRRGCTVALSAPGRWSYVFGDLPADAAPDIAAAARLLGEAADGLMPWRGRPDALKRGLIARIPPLIPTPFSEAAE